MNKHIAGAAASVAPAICANRIAGFIKQMRIVPFKAGFQESPAFAGGMRLQFRQSFSIIDLF